MALVLTFISGLFFLIGIIIYKVLPMKQELTIGSMACAAIVIIGLICNDLLPELISFHKWWLFLFVIIGLFIFLIADKYIPHHNHDHHENDELTKEHQDHIIHIGTITILALLLHNMIEGMALFNVADNDFKSGLLMLIGIGLHNIPFGFQIASSDKSQRSKLLIAALILSGFVGGLMFFFAGGVNEYIEGIIIAITLGMLMHILIFEFLKEIVENKQKKETKYGIIIGVILLIIIHFI